MISAVCSLLSHTVAQAATPSLTVGSASGQAGTLVTVPITFDPGTASVAGIQFNLTLPAGLSSGTVTAGDILNTAGKSVSTSVNGNTWTFIAFGLNQTTISSGTLLTAQISIAAGTSAGDLSLPISGVTYSDANGAVIAAGTSTSGSITVTAPPPPPPPPPSAPVITSSTTGTGTVGTAYSYQITASNSPSSYNATGLPAGLAVNTATGLISGTPTAAGTSSVSLSATNAGGTGTATLTLTVNSPPPPPPPPSSAPTISLGTATGAAGTSVSLPITFNPGSGSVAGIQFNLTLPAGLSSGTVTAGAILNTAAKSVSTSQSGNTWTFIVFGLNQTTISSGTLLTAQLNIAAGTAAGTLNVPISGATYSDPNGATIAAGTSTAGSVTVTAGAPPPPPPPTPAPVITSSTNASGTVGTAFSYQITASNSPTSYKATGLPTGLSVNTATGLISGTPTAAGTSSVALSATNSGGTGTATLTLTVNSAPPPPPPPSSAPTLALGTGTGAAGTSVSLPITFNPGTGSVAGIQFNLVLPAGLSSGTVTAGAILNTAGKSVSTSVSGSTWTFIVFGLNQNTISSGTLLTAQLNIAAGTAAGKLSVPITGVTYSDPNGAIIAAGTSTAGTVTVTAAANNPPTVATPASATPNPVTGKTTALSVLGADDGGEANLTYTWATTGTPPASVTFSANGTNASKNTTATFSKSGAYSFRVTIKDAGGLTVTSSVNVTVNATLTTITVTPPTIGVPVNGTQSFTANAFDQFNLALASQPAFTWTVSGGGNINASGLFTAGATAGGPFTVTAASGGKSGMAQVTVTGSVNTPPTVATPASATPNPVAGTSAALSVLGADNGGEANLIYTWTTSGNPPAGVSFSANGTNASKDTLVTFSAPGVYTLQAIIQDAGGLTVTSNVNVTVTQTLTSVMVSPPIATLAPGGTQSFSVTSLDQFDSAMTVQSPVTWSASGGGTIDSAGLFTAGTAAGGPFTITASANGKTDTAFVLIIAVGGTSGGTTLPTPDLSNLPASAPVDTTLGVGNASAYTNAGFTWTFTPVTAPTGSLSYSRSSLVTFNALAASGGAAFKTTSANTAPLISYGLVPGAYTISVQAFDSNGNVSPTASKSITLVSADLSSVRVYPNPWRSDRHAGKEVTFDQLTLGSTVKIFTVSGHLARTLSAAGSSVQWDLTNNSGDKVGSGLYIYLITDSSGNKTKGKLAIIR